MVGEYSFPEYFMDDENKQARNFIDILLNKIPEARCPGGYDGLKAHKWYDDFYWDKLRNGTLQSPYRPPTRLMLREEEMKNLLKSSKDI